MPNITFIINRSSGVGSKQSEALIEEIGAQFPSAKIERLSAHHKLEECLPPLDSEEEVVVAAGGDGTISAVADKLAGTKALLGVIPTGTFNHFAKDLGLPLDLKGALDVIKEGKAMEVDVGEANGRVFINNSSFGLYPRLVRLRSKNQFRLQCSKWWALLRGMVFLLLHFPVIEARLTVEGKELRKRTPFVFIGANRYRLDALQIGTRARLDEGILSVFTARDLGRLGLFRLAVKALFGRLHTDKDFESFCAEELQVDMPRKSVSISFDGEVTRMETPVRYRIRPKALRVIVPRAPR